MILGNFCQHLMKMGRISVKTVQSKSGLARFLSLPYSLYSSDSFYIAPLRLIEQMTLSPKSPFFEHGSMELFIAEDSSGRTLGRIAAIKNDLHLEKHKDNSGFFGFFEAIDSEEVASHLLNAASESLKSFGLSKMRGPANPSMNDSCGLLVDGFEKSPSFFMPYNPDFYEPLLCNNGFERVMTMYSYYLHRRYFKFSEVKAWGKEVTDHYTDLSLRPADRKKYSSEAKIILDIYNKSLSSHWGHVPMTEAEFSELARFFKYMVDTKLVCFLEKNGETIGFFLAVPDFNEIIKHLKNGRLLPFGWLQFLLRWSLGGIKSVRAAMGGVLPEYRGQGLAMVMALLAANDNWFGGYEGIEFSWILQTNRIFIDTLENIGAVRDKEYAMFERTI